MVKSVTPEHGEGVVALADEIPPLVSLKTPLGHEPHLIPYDTAPYRDEMVQFDCGHLSHAKFACCFFGEVLVPSDDLLAGRHECGDCLLKRTLSHLARCALCGRAILPGQPVVLYPDRKSFRVHPWRKIIPHPEDKGIKGWLKKLVGLIDDNVIGCTRADCCVSEMFFAGAWGDGEFVPVFGGKTLGDTFSSAEGNMVMVVTVRRSSPTSSES